MKNKKRNLIIFSTFIILVIGIYLIVPKTKEEESNKTKPNVNTKGFLTLMLEQDDGTYKKSSASTWPGMVMLLIMNYPVVKEVEN